MNNSQEYGNVSRTKMGIVLIFLLGIPVFGLTHYIRALENGDILYLKSKFSVVNLESNCEWTDLENYNQCFKKDFLQFVRKKTYYEGVLAFDFFIEIDKHDYFKHTTKIGKLYSRLDYFETLVSFFEINRSKVINRDKADFIGLTLAYFRRTTPLDSFRSAKGLLTKLSSEHAGFIESNPVLKNRIKILDNRYLQIQEEIID